MTDKYRITGHCPFGDHHVDVEIVYTYTPGRPAVMYLRNGDPGYPADPAEVELVSAEIREGVTLTKAWQQRLEDWASNWLNDEGFAEACERAEDTIEYYREQAAEYRGDR